MPSKEEERIQEEKEKNDLLESRKSMNLEVNVDDYIIGNTSEDNSKEKSEKNAPPKNDAFVI